MKLYKSVDKYFSELPPNTGRALVVGSRYYLKKNEDRRELYSNAVGVDMTEGPGVDYVHDLENPLPAEIGTFDHIDCVSVMEHCKKPWRMADTITQAAAPGATIYLSIPFVWRLHGYPNDYWRVTTAGFKILFPDVRWLSRGYLLSSGVWRHLVPSVDFGQCKYLERSEAVGYGLFVSR